ncbi:MAG: SDR family NAD(P)-dependent oxidoreductase [Dermatophilaceae bacterium]
MDLELNGKVAVVTGAGKGIGLAIATALAGEGAHVVAGTRTATPELTALAERHGTEVVLADLATANGPSDLVAQAVRRHGRIDVLVNNVGAATPRGGFLEVDDAGWQSVLDVILLSAVRTTRAALPTMLAVGSGAVVNISSINARLPFPMVVDYSAAKAAMTNLTAALSEEFAPRGIRVNTISPGPVRTPFWTAPGGFAEAMTAGSGDSAAAVLDEVLPQAMGISSGRVTEAHEVADLALFLASARAANITGADVVIDGGQVKTI